MDNTVNQQAIEDQEYLDKVAIEVMKSYLDNQKPKGFQDSVSVARVAYKQAIAMQLVRKTMLKELAEDVGIIKKEENSKTTP